MCVTSHLRRVRTLYKSILKLHRGLPHELKAFGDDYAKSEFRRHKSLKIEQQEVTVFMYEWTEYAINLAKQLGVKSIQKDKHGSKVGKDLEPEAIDKFRSEQVVQLHELYRTAKGLNEDEEVTEKK